MCHEPRALETEGPRQVGEGVSDAEAGVQTGDAEGSEMALAQVGYPSAKTVQHTFIFTAYVCKCLEMHQILRQPAGHTDTSGHPGSPPCRPQPLGTYLVQGPATGPVALTLELG